ncbi:hypothetical protein FDW83_15475 [Pseudarthrobacter sp. NamE2]|uniref:hypothetical protein n=1 Tax=Pseudarthrobacter sp. NamE2 TaxID=2576838 RepID=UPI0010FF55B5|nr:hypothetical protein [Pseudarthrobacter sp. NamE2]TLM81574.1 hypothetical protein FDW83_15475 [Pseudarthrobacter sp. NamE2]
MNRPGSGSPDQGANQDDDAVWLDLVARLQEDSPAAGQDPGAADPAARTGPAASFRDFDPLGLAASAEPSAARRQAPEGPQDESDRTGAGPRDYDVDDDGDDFVPEEPPSLAGTDPLTMLAWLAAVGGPVALLLSAMFWRSAPLLAVLGIVAAFVLGTVYLIMRLPQDKDEDDDGARV